MEIEPPPETLLFDKSQMEQALVNLLDNARKFTPRNGAIEIRGYRYFWERRACNTNPFGAAADRRRRQLGIPNAFRVDIRDSGPAIPAIHLRTIFEEYSSYGGGPDRSGGGLGLAICRMILQQHNGRVWAESQSAGAAFSFVLPIPSPVPAEQPPTPNRSEPAPDGLFTAVEESWS